jgi:hypothetical protein
MHPLYVIRDGQGEAKTSLQRINSRMRTFTCLSLVASSFFLGAVCADEHVFVPRSLRGNPDLANMNVTTFVIGTLIHLSGPLFGLM